MEVDIEHPFHDWEDQIKFQRELNAPLSSMGVRDIFLFVLEVPPQSSDGSQEEGGEDGEGDSPKWLILFGVDFVKLWQIKGGDDGFYFLIKELIV